MIITEMTAVFMTSGVRFAIAAFMLWLYRKNRNRFVIAFGLFFLLFGVHGLFRFFSVTEGNQLLYFVHRITLIGGTITILYALKSLGIGWVGKYHAIPAFAAAATALSYLDSYVFGGVQGEMAFWDHLLAGSYGLAFAHFPTLALGGSGLLIAAYYFNSFGKGMHTMGKRVMVCGFLLEGLLHFVAPFFIPLGFTWLLFIAGMVFTAMIGIGWGMSISVYHYPAAAAGSRGRHVSMLEVFLHGKDHNGSGR
ncbi:MAG: hypothetical protein HY367_01640 [Candidatus Aenigmarchaeota archaeon]|nr:hypothetical protein [Candidatus Aenigmarchaeota archaeon]